jgi:hypothetical protein
MPREAIVAAVVAAIIGMGRIDPARYGLWLENIAPSWMALLVGVQGCAFAVSGVACFALADVLSIEGFDGQWLLNGCLWGGSGYILLGVQLNAFDFDKVSAPWLPLSVVTGFARKMLDYLTIRRIDSLTDAELEQRAFTYYWRDDYPRPNVSPTAKLVQYQNLCEASAQLRIPAQAADGRGRLRAYVEAAMVTHLTPGQ